MFYSRKGGHVVLGGGSEKTLTAAPLPALPSRLSANLIAWIAGLLLLWRITSTFQERFFFLPSHNLTTDVHWKSCGEGFDGFQCANISVPLDHYNASDERTITLAVNRFLATDPKNRQGAIFLNPGGPGGSGTSMAFSRGPHLSKVIKGQYDMIGFDPRGVNLTRPYVSCFDSKLEEDIFKLSMNDFTLNLPTNLSSPCILSDLEIQIAKVDAGIAAVAGKCANRTGEGIKYMSTESVVRDIEYLSAVIEGPDARVNYWGTSYGTVIGQYLIELLAPEKIGRVVIDGVVNPFLYSSYPSETGRERLLYIEDVLSHFVYSCFQAKSNCSLASLYPSGGSEAAESIFSTIDRTIDLLYESPQPIMDLPVPAIAEAHNLRQLLYSSMYSITKWPDLAEHLVNAFNGNFTGIVNSTMVKVDTADLTKPDDSSFSGYVTRCADSQPYDDSYPAPTPARLAELTLERVQRYSLRMGESSFMFSFCHSWEEAGVNLRQARFAGPFDMKNDTLETPVLILSQTFDPVTGLQNALAANERLGNNARLVQQLGGTGHCALGQVSYCTAHIVQTYFLTGTVPEEKHTNCTVDQLPWVHFDYPWSTGSALEELDLDENELRRAWRGVVEDFQTSL